MSRDGRRRDVPDYLPDWPTTWPNTAAEARTIAAGTASHRGRTAGALIVAAGAAASVVGAVGAGPAIAMALGIAAALSGHKRPPHQQPTKRRRT